MSENSNSDVLGAVESSSSSGRDSSAPSLDEALEQCVLALENGETELNSLAQRFPLWKLEIAEFLDNWGGMERLATSLLAPQASPDSIDIHQFPNRRFGDYELLEKIGVGGMGVIYKARQIRLDRIVALKMIHGERHDRLRFQLEAESAAALSHPNIVSIHEIGEHQGHLFFTMNLVEGCNLKEYLDRGPINISEAARITKTIADAVHYAHQHGILHRDLKPANVMLDIEVQPHITDFGLAKQLDRDTEITRSGTVMGTPGYMAPEQAAGRNSNLTMATDVYGVGAILYSLLTRQAPFTGESSLEILRRVVDETPVSPRNFRTEIPRDLDTICMKCLEKSPESRYASAKLLSDDLSRFLLGQPVLARPIAPTERFWRWCLRNPALSILSATVIVLLVAAAVISILLAVSERNARIISETGDRREKQLLEEVEDALLQEQQARLLTVESNANKYLLLGLAEARRANTSAALFWFAQAAVLTKDDPYHLPSHLFRIQSWLEDHPIPIAAFMIERGFGSRAERIQFRNGAEQLLCITGSELVVLDYGKNELWRVEETFADVSFARWSEDGQLLAIGERGGRVLLLDSDSREIQTQFDAGAPVGQIAFSQQGSAIAVATWETPDRKPGVRIWDYDQEKWSGASMDNTHEFEYLAFNGSGDRLITVNQGAKAAVYSIHQEQIKELFEAPALVRATSDSKRSFWPTLLHDDSVLMVRSNWRELDFYDADTGERFPKQSMDANINDIVVSTDGDRIILCGNRNAEVARISPLSGSAGQQRQTVDRLEHGDRVVTAAFGSNHMIATGSWDHSVALWRLDETSDSIQDVPYHKELLTMLPHQNRVRHVDFSPDGSKLITIQTDGLIRLWDIPLVDRRHYAVAVPRSGSMARLIGRNHWLSSGLSRKTGRVEKVDMYEIDSGKLVGSTQGNINTDGAIMDTACSPDQDQLATIHARPRRRSADPGPSGEAAGSLRFWKWPEGQSRSSPLPMPSEPRSIDYHPDGRQLAVFTEESEIVLVDTISMEIQDVLSPFQSIEVGMVPNRISNLHYNNGKLKYSPDGQTIVSWRGQEGVWVWDVETRKLRYPAIENNGMVVTSVEYSPDGNRIVIAGGRNPFVYVIDIRSGEHAGKKIESSPLCNYARFGPDGDRVIVANRAGNARIYDWRTGEQHQGLHIANVDIVDAAYTPDSKYMVTLGLDHRMCVWDADDAQLLIKPVQTPPWARQILISPDSRYLIVASGRHENVCFSLDRLLKLPALDLDRLQITCELIAGTTLNNSEPVALTTADWYSRWQNWLQKVQGVGTISADGRNLTE